MTNKPIMVRAHRYEGGGYPVESLTVAGIDRRKVLERAVQLVPEEMRAGVRQAWGGVLEGAPPNDFRHPTMPGMIAETEVRAEDGKLRALITVFECEVVQ